MKKYKKKPVIVRAEKWAGEFTPELLEALKASDRRFAKASNGDLLISTLEGTMRATKGDYIIFGVNNEPYPCKPDVFIKTYERVEEDEPSEVWRVAIVLRKDSNECDFRYRILRPQYYSKKYYCGKLSGTQECTYENCPFKL